MLCLGRIFFVFILLIYLAFIIKYGKVQFIISFFLRFYLFIFRERKGGRKRGREISDTLIDCFLHAPRGDLDQNPGMYPDGDLNQRPFSSQAGTQSTESHQQGLIYYFFKHVFCCVLFTLLHVC